MSISAEYTRVTGKLGKITLPKTGTAAQRRYALQNDTKLIVVASRASNDLALKFGGATVEANITGTPETDFDYVVEDGYKERLTPIKTLGGSTYVSVSADTTDFVVWIQEVK